MRTSIRSDFDVTFLKGVASLAGASALVLLVPFAVVLIGLPVAIAIRLLIEAIGVAVR